jgi:hydrogenase nickel incorporation protein HypA/HybF
MHEFTIAQSLLDLVREHAPNGSQVKVVRLKIGPMQGIVPEAMRMAWQVARENTCCQDAQLDMQMLPWDLTCPDCGRTWQSDDMFDTCACGCETPSPHGSSEMQLMSLEVDEPEQ